MSESRRSSGDPEAGFTSREYPRRPIVGVGGVILVDGRVVLIRRRFEPMADRWSLPGGAVDVGETLLRGLVREMKEETGLDVEVGPVVDVFDRITHDADGRVRFHYVLADYLCRVTGGTLAAGSDAADIALVDPNDLDRYDLTDKTLDVIRRALALGG